MRQLAGIRQAKAGKPTAKRDHRGVISGSGEVKKDVALKDQILKVLETNPAYGHRRVALALGIKISMSTKASPWENAYQESFYDNFKTDLGLEFERFATVGEFVEAIHKTIRYYNQHRIHTKLKMSPQNVAGKIQAQVSKPARLETLCNKRST